LIIQYTLFFDKTSHTTYLTFEQKLANKRLFDVVVVFFYSQNFIIYPKQNRWNLD